ncbi:MAG: heme-binding protein [bacterium]
MDHNIRVSELRMNVTRLLFLFLVCSFTAQALAIEEPDFVVVEMLGKVEIRLYDGYWVAQTRVQGEFSEAGGRAFEPLFDYLSGANSAGTKISMTAPVQQRTDADSHVVNFVMPQDAVASGLPKPAGEAVTLAQIPAQLVAALRYSGGWQEKRYRKFEQQLRKQLDTSDFSVCGAATWARYNPPFWPGFMRRNEVLIPVAKGRCETPSEDQPGDVSKRLHVVDG